MGSIKRDVHPHECVYTQGLIQGCMHEEVLILFHACTGGQVHMANETVISRLKTLCILYKVSYVCIKLHAAVQST